MNFAKKMALAAVAAAALLSLAACSNKDGGQIRTAKDLNGKRVGVLMASTSEEWAGENLPSARITAYRLNSDAIVDLNRGVIDAVLLEDIAAPELLAGYDDLQVIKSPGSFVPEEYGVAMRKGNPELLGAVNAAIEKIKASGEYDLLYSSFIAPPDGKMTIPSFDIPAGEGTLRLGTDPGYPPFGYTVGSDIVGFDVSLGQLIGRELGVNIEVVGMTFAALIPALEAGEIDLIAASMTITEERQKIIDFSVPYFATEQVIVVKK